jgi:hypothetical protein
MQSTQGCSLVVLAFYQEAPGARSRHRVGCPMLVAGAGPARTALQSFLEGVGMPRQPTPALHKVEVVVAWGWRVHQALPAHQAPAHWVWGALVPAAGAMVLTPPAAACVAACLVVVRVGWCTAVQRQQHHRGGLGAAVSFGGLGGVSPPPTQWTCEGGSTPRHLGEC